jgi:hypothetical protein
LEGTPEHILDVGLPHQRQVREGGVRQIGMAQPGLHHFFAHVDACFR